MEKNYYVNLMEKEIEDINKSGKRPKLLLHSCCAPCSSSVIELLVKSFDVTVYYYNPNIYPEDEFEKRWGDNKDEYEKKMKKAVDDTKGEVITFEDNIIFAIVKFFANFL